MANIIIVSDRFDIATRLEEALETSDHTVVIAQSLAKIHAWLEQMQTAPVFESREFLVIHTDSIAEIYDPSIVLLSLADDTKKGLKHLAITNSPANFGGCNIPLLPRLESFFEHPETLVAAVNAVLAGQPLPLTHVA